MKTVGISNLRNSLSRYINMVKTGEKILITDHNKIIAEIIPSTGSEDKEGILYEYIEEQTSNKKIVKSTRKLTLKKRIKKGKYNSEKMLEIYNETRSER